MTATRLTCTSFLMLALSCMPISVAGQPTPVYRIGVLLPGATHASAIDGLRDGLRELGLEEGKQFVLHVRDVKGDMKSAEVAANNLEREQVDLIFSITTSVTVSAKRATKSVPIVFYAGTDPVSTGLVESFRKPGGRLSGIHGHVASLAAKRLELLKEMVPGLRRVVTFYRPDNPAAQQSMKMVRAAARQLKLDLIERPVASVEELRVSLGALSPRDGDAISYVADAFVTSQTELIIERARAIKLPTMVGDRGGVVKGALAGYGESYYAIGRLAAKHVQRISLGTSPGDLAVEQVDKLHLAVNLKVARELGVTIPHSLLSRADEVIE